jgi:hypothetical protein
MFIHRLAAIAAATAACAFFAGSAGAAPQVLGLVASNGVPTPLTCVGTECSAHFSTFCLQEARPAPSQGQPYAIAEGGELRLVIRTADGRSMSLPGNEHLKVSTLIGFTSVRISVPAETLRALGATQVAVEVGPEVSLVPQAVANDPDPQMPEEVALATGPMRELAGRTFETPGPSSDAARVTNALINALPDSAQEQEAARDGLWERTVDETMLASLTPDGRVAAERIYQGCRISVESHSAFTMRGCLELRHADLMAATNHKFWEESGGY